MENHNKETENDKRTRTVVSRNKHKKYNKHKKSLFCSGDSLLDLAERRERGRIFSAIVCFDWFFVERLFDGRGRF